MVRAHFRFFHVRRTHPSPYISIKCTDVFPSLTISSSLLVLPRYLLYCTILIPTAYLCIVDNLALHKGVWKIEEDTKLNYRIFGSLDIEYKYLFFLRSYVLMEFHI